MHYRSVIIPFLLISFSTVFDLTNLDFFVIFIFFTTFCPLIIFFLFFFFSVLSIQDYFFGKHFQRKNSNISVLVHIYFHISGKMAGTKLNDPLLIRYEDGLRNYDEMFLHIDSDTSLEVATKRVFVVGHKFILPYLKELAHSFGLEWIFCTFRSGFTIKCNRASRKSKYGCELSIRFMGLIKSHYKITDYVE